VRPIFWGCARDGGRGGGRVARLRWWLMKKHAAALWLMSLVVLAGVHAIAGEPSKGDRNATLEDDMQQIISGMNIVCPEVRIASVIHEDNPRIVDVACGYAWYRVEMDETSTAGHYDINVRSIN
jgi:hypothetical protein